MTTIPRWQKRAAVAPIAVLVGALGAAVIGPGFATASDTELPQIPSSALEQPASVVETPAGLDADVDTTVQSLSAEGIPAVALTAYRRSAELLKQADEQCGLSWTVVAAIGRVESNHGRTGGNNLGADGVAKPGVYGLPLDGKDGRALIRDSDQGALDEDPVFDRAVGPMQFIPGTWKSVGVDADGDGVKNPQDIDDAATAAGVYLCAGTGDLAQEADLRSAVRRYNRSDTYVDTVVRIAKAYESGQFTKVPTSSPMFFQGFSGNSNWKPVAPGKKPGTGGGAGSSARGDSGTDGGSTPGTGGSNPTSPGAPGNPAAPGIDLTPKGTTSGAIKEQVDESPVTKPLAPVLDLVLDLVTAVEARLLCGLVPPKSLDIRVNKAAFDTCVKNLTGKPEGTKP